MTPFGNRRINGNGHPISDGPSPRFIERLAYTSPWKPTVPKTFQAGKPIAASIRDLIRLQARVRRSFRRRLIKHRMAPSVWNRTRVSRPRAHGTPIWGNPPNPPAAPFQPINRAARHLLLKGKRLRIRFTWAGSGAFSR